MKRYSTGKIAKKPKPRLAIDFDGVIHRYSRGFQDGSIYDRPMAGAKRALTALHKKWWIYIFTTRARTPVDCLAIGRWLKKHGIPFDQVVAHKPIAFAYIDDRAIHFDSWPQARKQLKETVQRHNKRNTGGGTILPT